MPAPENSQLLARTAAQAAADKLAVDIVALDVSDHLVLTDVFVIASAANERQVDAVVDFVEEQMLRQHGCKALRREGRTERRWVLVDFGDIIVHVFHTEDREFYGLDKLWGDCPALEAVEGAALT